MRRCGCSPRRPCNLREDDVVARSAARIRGDAAGHAKRSLRRAERLRLAFEAPAARSGSAIECTRIGVACGAPNGKIAQLIAYADVALYRAKAMDATASRDRRNAGRCRDRVMLPAPPQRGGARKHCPARQLTAGVDRRRRCPPARASLARAEPSPSAVTMFAKTRVFVDAGRETARPDHEGEPVGQASPRSTHAVSSGPAVLASPGPARRARVHHSVAGTCSVSSSLDAVASIGLADRAGVRICDQLCDIPSARRRPRRY